MTSRDNHLKLRFIVQVLCPMARCDLISYDNLYVTVVKEENGKTAHCHGNSGTGAGATKRGDGRCLNSNISDIASREIILVPPVFSLFKEQRVDIREPWSRWLHQLIDSFLLLLLPTNISEHLRTFSVLNWQMLQTKWREWSNMFYFCHKNTSFCSKSLFIPTNWNKGSFNIWAAETSLDNSLFIIQRIGYVTIRIIVGIGKFSRRTQSLPYYRGRFLYI